MKYTTPSDAETKAGKERATTLSSYEDQKAAHKAEVEKKLKKAGLTDDEIFYIRNGIL